MGDTQAQDMGGSKIYQEPESLGLEHRIATGLLQLRKSKRMTQEELARKIDTKQAVISRVENGASIPSLRFAKRVAEALDAEVYITFQPQNTQKESVDIQPSSGKIEYICVDCLYRWESKIERSVMQCPQCHKRQGIMFSEYSKALRTCRDIRLQVEKSPPPKPPPIREIIKIIQDNPNVLKLISQTAGNTLPSPRLPISLLLRLIEQSRQEQIEEQST